MTPQSPVPAGTEVRTQRRQERRAALDRHFEIATGRKGSGLPEYVQRLREETEKS